MFKIGEFSKITQVSIRMLRYYDEQRLLIPNMIDESNGYRMYSANQIEQLQKIILLRDMGFGVREIKSLLYDFEHQEKKLDIDIVMKVLPMQHVISLWRIVPDYWSEGMLWEEVDIEICLEVPHLNVGIENCDIIYRQISKVRVVKELGIEDREKSVTI